MSEYFIRIFFGTFWTIQMLISMSRSNESELLNYLVGY